MTARRVLGLVLVSIGATATAEANLLAWQDGPAKAAIVQFVRDVTDEKSKFFVPAAERIAVLDNDGTLWSEQPIYFQAAFMLDRLKAVALDHPEWRDNPAYQALVSRDEAQLARVGMKPVLELLACLREHGFQTWIVSGDGIEFMRAWTEAAYGIPPQQVIGSIAETKFELRGGEPALVREPAVAFVDDGTGKPVGIYRAIGRRPIAAFGNSDGDLQMLQYAAIGEGSRLAVIVHHDDMEREYAYDRDSRIGRLDKALDEAKARKWVVVSMKDDWKRVHPWENLR